MSVTKQVRVSGTKEISTMKEQICSVVPVVGQISHSLCPQLPPSVPRARSRSSLLPGLAASLSQKVIVIRPSESEL